MPRRKRPSGNLPALPAKTRGTLILEEVKRRGSTAPRRLKLGFRVTKGEVQKAIDRELRSRLVLQGQDFREIAASGAMGYGRVRARAPVILSPQDELIVRLHRMIKKAKMDFSSPGKLIDFMKKN